MMKSVFLIVLSVFSWASLSQAENFQSYVESAAKKHRVSLDQLSILVIQANGANPPLVDINAKTALIPASISKLTTSLSVLEQFPLGAKLKTSLWADGKIQKNILKGNLVLRGAGDPGFVSENMWFLVNSFLRNEVAKIEGDIIVDDSLFDSVRYDQSRQKERVDRAYDAPVGAMSFNWNSVNVFVRPTAKGEKVKVFADPDNEYIRVINKATTTGGGDNKLIVERKDDEKGDGDVIIVSGHLGEKLKEVVVYKNITRPDMWSGYNLKAFLKQRGVEVTGKIKTGVLPKTAELMAESESKPVEFMLADMNKFSNNYVAEMLTKLAAAQSGANPASLSKGVELIAKDMKNLGLSEKEAYIESPSGLTRKNKLSSYATVQILKKLSSDFSIQPEFFASLPISGIDGTLKRRMKKGPALGVVRAKTGSIDGVVSLAGFASSKTTNDLLIFSMIYNGSQDETSMRSFFDQVMEHILE